MTVDRFEHPYMMLKTPRRLSPRRQRLLDGFKCASCLFWVRTNEDALRGRCHRRAPMTGHFPTTAAADWCAEHENDEDQA